MKKGKRVFLILLLMIQLIAGCSDLVEVQNRDFILAMGISEQNGLYNIILANPDFGKDTKEEGSGNQKEVRSYKSEFISGVEEAYDRSSDKRLDYRHLEAVILDKSIVKKKTMLNDLILYLKNKYEVSRNALLFYYPGSINEVFSKQGVVGRSIGDFIQNLDRNYNEKHEIKPVTIGDLMNASAQNQPLTIPAISVSEEGISMDGAAVFYEMAVQKLLTEREYVFFLISSGIGREFTFHVLNHMPITIQKVEQDIQYDYIEKNPEILLTLTIKIEEVEMEGRTSDEAVKLSLADQLENQISELLFDMMKKEHLDILRIYDQSAIQCRNIWLDYEGRREALLSDVDMTINVQVE